MNILVVAWIEATLAFLGCMYLWHLHCAFQVDALRQRLFAVRDGFFASADRGEIGFNDDAYRITRITLNGMIRFAHELGFLRLVVSAITSRYLLKVHDQKYEKHLASALKKLPSNDARSLVLKSHEDMHRLVLKHLFLTSPPCMAIGFVLAAYFSVRQLFAGRKQRVKHIPGAREVRRLDTEAYDIGLAAAGAKQSFELSPC